MTSTTLTPKTYTAEEVAVLLGCSPATVRRSARRGDLPDVGLGRTVRIPRSYIDALLQPNGAIADLLAPPEAQS